MITDIVNLSLSTGVFPDQVKYASVKSLLKKSYLDRNPLKFFRPISNLSYLSKLMEKLVDTRLSDYIDENNLSELTQSDYKSGHENRVIVCAE